MGGFPLNPHDELREWNGDPSEQTSIASGLWFSGSESCDWCNTAVDSRGRAVVGGSRPALPGKRRGMRGFEALRYILIVIGQYTVIADSPQLSIAHAMSPRVTAPESGVILESVRIDPARPVRAFARRIYESKSFVESWS